MSLGTTALRGIVGPLFIGHGAQKLWGSFGGHGPEGTGGYFESIGLRPGRRHATAAGISEVVGGTLLTLGALTPIAASLISGTMITAIRKVHIKNGPWVSNGGYEYNAVVLAAMTALTDLGPGRPSVDAALFPRMKGPGWAVMQLAAGAAGSALATSRRFSEPAPAAPQEGQGMPGDPATSEDRERFTHDEPADVRTPLDTTT